MAVKKQPVKRNIATLNLVAEFETDSVDLGDITENIRAALEQLRGIGYVTSAKLHVPEMTVEMEDWY